MDIKVNYHSSILINNEIFIDPLKVNGNCKAKYIFITHPHWDHFSVEDIKKILTNETKIICPKSMEDELKKTFDNFVISVEPNKEYEVDKFKFKTFSSYNIDKAFHPKQNKWVGYIIEIDSKAVAIVGDSDNTPELREINADVLLIPIGGTYTMDLEQAVEVTNKINPQKVIPTHYGEIVGNKEMGKLFKDLIDRKIICELQI